MLRVTPIYGSSLSSSTSGRSNDDDDPLEWLSSPVPSCTLVEYAGVRVLLNVGWDESLPSSDDVVNSKKDTIIPQSLPDDIDAILLCDSTLSSLGGLPKYFCASKKSKRGRVPRSSNNTHSAKRQRNPPFLATYPTVKMGQMTIYDHHASLSLDGTNPGYSLEDVDAVFSKDSFHTLKYSQTVYLPLDDTDTEDSSMMDSIVDPNNNQTKQKKLSNSKTSNKSLAITPHLSGHVVGGTYWVLKQLSDDTEIILAPMYHHAKERHLAGSTLHKFGVNADALLTMPGGPRGLLGKLYQPPPKDYVAQQNNNNNNHHEMIKYKKGNKPILSSPVGNRSEAELIESIMAALRRDGNVLLPVDASGRVLELLLLLDRHWEKQRLGGAYNLCWVGPMSLNTIEFARSQLEWMAAPLGAQFDSQRGHPYGLKSIKICSSVGELENVIERSGGNPTCVLASGASMDHGPARDLLIKWSGNPDNLVLITDSTRCVPRGDVLFGRDGDKTATSKAVNKAAAAVVPVEEAADAEDKDGNQQLGPALLPGEISSYTTSSQLLYHWCTAKALGEEMPDEVSVDVYVPHRSPLSGRELQTFLAQEEEERRVKKAEMEQRAMMKEIELARGRLRLGGDGDDEKTTGGGTSKVAGGGNATAGSKSKATTSATGGTSRPKKKSRFDQTLFIKFSKPVHMTFDVREEAVGIGQPDAVAKYGITESIGSGRTDVLEDDYGIAVKSDSFVDIVTGVDPSKFAGKSGRIGEEVNRRGLGFGSDGKPVIDTGKTDLGVVTDDGEGGDEGINEKMLEVADLSSGKGIIKGRNGRPPIKVSAIPRRLEVLAEVVYTPLEGRVDARAARQSVRALQPRHLVIIGGPRANSLLLADALQSTSASKTDNSTQESLAHVLTDGETVQLTVGHSAYGVRLIDTPYLTQEEKEELELAGKEVEPVEPYEAKIGDCSVSLVDYVATGKKWAVDGSIVLAPRRQQSTLKQPSLMLSTREVLLTDLRAEVTALGMKAEYGYVFTRCLGTQFANVWYVIAQVLIIQLYYCRALSGYSQLTVNGKIVVRKDNATGKLNVEGKSITYHISVPIIVALSR